MLAKVETLFCRVPGADGRKPFVNFCPSSDTPCSHDKTRQPIRLDPRIPRKLLVPQDECDTQRELGMCPVETFSSV